MGTIFSKNNWQKVWLYREKFVPLHHRCKKDKSVEIFLRPFGSKRHPKGMSSGGITMKKNFLSARESFP